MLIVIPEYGKRHLTNRLIESIPESYHDSIYVGDDGWQGEQKPLIAGHEVKWDDNLGFAGNVNRTVKVALDRRMIKDPQGRHKTLAIVNNDIEVIGDAIQKLEALVTEMWWVVGPAIMVPSNYVGREQYRHHQFFDNNIVKAGTGMHFVTSLSGAFLCMPVWVWVKLEGFDTENFRAYFEDDDFCVRANKAGIKVASCLDARVKHDVNSTYKDVKDRHAQIKASKAAFEKKHPKAKWNHRGDYEYESIVGNNDTECKDSTGH